MEPPRARPRFAEPRPGDERAGRSGRDSRVGEAPRASAIHTAAGARVGSAPTGTPVTPRSMKADAQLEAVRRADADLVTAARTTRAGANLDDASWPAISDAEQPPEIRGEPAPRHGGLLTLLRFMRAHRMLNHRYARLIVRLLWLKLRFRGRLQTDGLAFVGPGVTFEIGRHARVVLGRWSWVGHGTKIRAHEGEVIIGAKSVLGQECTISAFQHVSIGRECVIADRVMMIDFDHGVVEVERPIRLQGIYKRDVRVGNNVWIGYGACILRGVSVGDNAILGTSTVVTKDIPDDAVVAGIPARVIRRRPKPRGLRWR